MTEADYENMISTCPEALDYYRQRGVDDLNSAFDMANILSAQRNQHYAEGAFFYKVAYNYHSKDPAQYPLAHVLLMARLVCLLKGDLPFKEEEVNELRSLSIPLYNFVMGWKQYKENNDAWSAINLMQNCYEEFHTGEETDTVYLRIMLDLFNYNPDISRRPRTTGSADFNVIPNNIFMYWDHEPPPEIVENFDYYKQLGHFNLRIFNKAEASEWLYQNYGVEARHVFLSAGRAAEAADFFRVHLLNYYGGWWSDADIKIRSIEQFYNVVPSVYEHVFFLTSDGVVHNDFFGTLPNSSILNDCMLSLYRNSFLHTGLFIPYKTGPGIFTRSLNRHFYRALRGESKRPSCICLNSYKFDEVIEQINAPYKERGLHWQ